MRTIIQSFLILFACVIVVSAQNTVSFDNQSGEAALVKLIGPSTNEIKVPDATKQSVQASAGKYFIKVRYGVQGKYHYAKGHEFTVDQTATTTSDITITLHKVVNGNYESSPINEQEFGLVDAAVAAPSRDTRENRNKEIYDAIKNDDLEKVKVLLKDNLNLVSSKDEYSRTPLRWAVWYGHKDVAKLLLENKADVNASEKDGTTVGRLCITPLLLTAGGGYKDVAELLLANNAEVNAQDRDGGTPLHHAADKGHKDVAKLLLAYKAKINAKKKDGATPLHLAAYGGYQDVVELLLAEKADVNAKDNNGFTPLHYAATKGHKGVAELLVANKADINATGNDGWTPLHAAIFYGRQDMAKWLRLRGGHEQEFDAPPPNWPTYLSELIGSDEVRVKNPNDFKVRVGLRSDGKGKDFIVSPSGTESVNVPNGRYDIYFNYSSDPSGLYQGDGFTLENNGAEITITKVVNGNYGIRKVK